MRRPQLPGLLLSLALCSCDGGGSAGPGASTSSPAATLSRPAASATAASTPAATAAPEARFAGQWTGSYQASKATVFVPRGVKHVAQEKDDGSSATGQGTLELRIDAQGQVTGKASGALGAQSVRGVMQEDMLRAGVSPVDPASDDGMTGVLVGKADAEAIVAELRVSNHDASVVRSSQVRLERR